MTTVVIRPAASEDIDSAADYYAAEEGIDLALHFLEAVELAFGVLGQHPRIGVAQSGVRSELEGCRRWNAAPPFEVHQIFYVLQGDVIEVLRVLHGSRDIPTVLG